MRPEGPTNFEYIDAEKQSKMGLGKKRLTWKKDKSD